MAGKLFIVPTPIGNLGDITLRALDALKTADFIAAEDTRVTLGLLNHFGIKKPLISYYEHSPRGCAESIASRILAGEDCALVSDAGTPIISDPGAELFSICLSRGIEAVALPGACAVIPALCLSGLDASRFCFEGFLSTNRKNRLKHLESLKSETRTMVFYEAPHKLRATLSDLLAAFGDRRVSVSRELTKLFEETLRTTLVECAAHFEKTTPRGEFVLCVEGSDKNAEAVSPGEAELIARGYVDDGMSVRDAARLASAETGVPKNRIYAALTKETRPEDGR